MSRSSITLTVEPALREALEARARAENSTRAEGLHRAAEEHIAREQALSEEIDRLCAEADKGVFVSSERMREWFASLGTENELPEPEPDVFVGPAAKA
jgi:predicted transcriptional regulator